MNADDQARIEKEVHETVERIQEMKASGYSEAEIAYAMSLLTTEVRIIFVTEHAEARKRKMENAKLMKTRGYSNEAIANALGLPENDVRSMLEPPIDI